MLDRRSCRISRTSRKFGAVAFEDICRAWSVPEIRSGPNMRTLTLARQTGEQDGGAFDRRPRRLNLLRVTNASRIRCAIYTRKSSEEGLEQGFNSLDAQREACAAYVASQRHEDWRLVREHYDDGGVSGGTLERPALQRLLADIDRGRVNMVVVYKIDRLTRSLTDFAKMVERFDAAAAPSFRSPRPSIPRPRWAGLPSTCSCPSPSSSARSPPSGSATRSPPRRRRGCGWAGWCRSATTSIPTRRCAGWSSTNARRRLSGRSSGSMISMPACGRSQRRLRGSASAPSGASSPAARPAVAVPSPAARSTSC